MIDDAQPQSPPAGAGFAIAALVIGIVGLLIWLVAPVALAFGIVALVKRQSKGMAITGIVLGGLGTLLLPIAIIAAIAIPNLLESRVTANEAAAAATVKSGIFPAEVQFQAACYVDQDGNSTGEHGTLGELSGRQAAGKAAAGTVRLLGGPLAHGDIANGYHYRVYLPDGRGGAITSDDAPRTPDPAAASAQEKAYVVYAWPVDRGTGRRMFALTADGQLRSLPWDGGEPAWNAALAQGWDAPPTWPVYQR